MTKLKMAMKILAMAIFAGLLHSFLIGAHADTIKMAAMNACPYNCDPETDGKKGFMVDVAERIFRDAGHTVVSKVVPFNRAIRGTEEGTYDALAISNPNDSEKLLMPKIPNAMIQGVFLVRKGETWRYEGLDSLKSIKLASFPGATWEEKDVNHYLETTGSPAVQMIYGEDPLEVGIQMLLRKRVDSCLTEMNTARYYGAKIGLNLDERMEIAGRLASTPHYISFSPENPKSVVYARILDQGMKELRASGQLAEILQKYGMSDWKNNQIKYPEWTNIRSAKVALWQISKTPDSGMYLVSPSGRIITFMQKH